MEKNIEKNLTTDPKDQKRKKMTTSAMKSRKSERIATEGMDDDGGEIKNKKIKPRIAPMMRSPRAT